MTVTKLHTQRETRSDTNKNVPTPGVSTLLPIRTKEESVEGSETSTPTQNSVVQLLTNMFTLQPMRTKEEPVEGSESTTPTQTENSAAAPATNKNGAVPPPKNMFTLLPMDTDEESFGSRRFQVNDSNPSEGYDPTTSFQANPAKDVFGNLIKKNPTTSFQADPAKDVFGDLIKKHAYISRFSSKPGDHYSVFCHRPLRDMYRDLLPVSGQSMQMVEAWLPPDSVPGHYTLIPIDHPLRKWKLVKNIHQEARRFAPACDKQYTAYPMSNGDFIFCEGEELWGKVAARWVHDGDEYRICDSSGALLGHVRIVTTWTPST